MEEYVKGFERGVGENNPYKINDSAEKVWNALIQATNALLQLPSSHWERRRVLRELKKRFPE